MNMSNLKNCMCLSVRVQKKTIPTRGSKRKNFVNGGGEGEDRAVTMTLGAKWAVRQPRPSRQQGHTAIARAGEEKGAGRRGLQSS